MHERAFHIPNNYVILTVGIDRVSHAYFQNNSSLAMLINFTLIKKKHVSVILWSIYWHCWRRCLETLGSFCLCLFFYPFFLVFLIEYIYAYIQPSCYRLIFCWCCKHWAYKNVGISTVRIFTMSNFLLLYRIILCRYFPWIFNMTYSE